MSMACLGFLLLPLLPTGDDLVQHLIPASCDGMVIVDMRVIRDSGYFDEDLREGFNQMLQDNEQIRKISETLNFDPAQQIHSFLVTFNAERNEVGNQRAVEAAQRRQDGPPRDGGDEKGLIVIRGDFDFPKFSKLLSDMADEGNLTLYTIQDLPVYYNHRNRRPGFFALLDSSTMFASLDKGTMEEAIQGISELRKPSEQIQELLQLKQQDSRTAFLVSGPFPEQARRNIGRNPQFSDIAEDLRTYQIVGKLDKTSEVRASVQLASEEKALRTREILNGLLQFGKLALAAQDRNENPRADQALRLMDGLTLTSEKTEVVARLSMPEEFLKELILQGREDRAEFRRRRDERRAQRERAQQEQQNN